MSTEMENDRREKPEYGASSAANSENSGSGASQRGESSSQGAFTGTPVKLSRALMERFPESGLELTAENLPVLNAFNEFLAIERRASRRRFQGLFWLFLMLLLAAMASAFIVGRVVVRAMQTEVAAERELADRERQRMADSISRVATNAAEHLNRELGRRDQAVRYTYRTLTDHIAGQTNTVVELRETMTILEEEIDALEQRLRDLTSRDRDTRPTGSAHGTAHPPSFLDPELERRIEEDFAEAYRRARIWRALPEAPADAGRERLPADPPDREAGATRPTPPLTIETPVGGSVPWRL